MLRKPVFGWVLDCQNRRWDGSTTEFLASANRQTRWVITGNRSQIVRFGQFVISHMCVQVPTLCGDFTGINGYLDSKIRSARCKLSAFVDSNWITFTRREGVSAARLSSDWIKVRTSSANSCGARNKIELVVSSRARVSRGPDT